MHWYSLKGVTLWWVIYSSLRKQPFFSAPAPITLGEEGRLFLQARIISGVPSWSKKICSQSDFIMLLIVVYWTSVVCNILALVQDWPHQVPYFVWRMSYKSICCPFLFFRENFTVVARLALNSVSSRSHTPDTKLIINWFSDLFQPHLRRPWQRGEGCFGPRGSDSKEKSRCYSRDQA